MGYKGIAGLGLGVCGVDVLSHRECPLIQLGNKNARAIHTGSIDNPKAFFIHSQIEVSLGICKEVFPIKIEGIFKLQGLGDLFVKFKSDDGAGAAFVVVECTVVDSVAAAMEVVGQVDEGETPVEQCRLVLELLHPDACGREVAMVVAGVGLVDTMAVSEERKLKEG